VTVASPWVLLGLVVVAAIMAFDLWRPWRASFARKAVAVVFRAVLLTALLFGLAGPQARWTVDAATWVFVLDRSASMGDAQLDGAVAAVQALAAQAPVGSRLGLVLVDGGVEIAVAPGAAWRVDRPSRSERLDGTDIGAGVQAALALIDPAGGGRIVVVSDGGDTVGGAAAAAERARVAGVPVDGVQVAAPAPAADLVEVALDAVVVRPGETASGVATVRGPPGGGGATLRIAVPGEPEATIPIDLPDADLARARFEIPVAADAAPGPRRVEVSLDVGPSAPLFTTFTVGPPPTVLVVADRPVEVVALIAALRAQGFGVVERTAASALPEDLADVDLVVLGDVAAKALPGDPVPIGEPFIASLRRWVSAGGGLVTLGGDRTYELGGWGATPIAHVLPLDLAPESEDVEPPATVVHILDNSASMGDWTGHQRKMALANEATVASMRLMRPKDAIEVMAVNTAVQRVVPLQPVVDPARLAASIRSIKPSGGGIYVYTSLIAAERALADATTPLQHVILYSDAQDAEEKVAGLEMGWGPGPNAFQVASRLRSRGVTLSVIALGDPRDQDVPFLRELALVGGGRFSITREATELTALYVEETRQLVRSVVHDRRFQARVAAPHPALEGVDLRRAPPLLGYVEVAARETATVSLLGPNDAPVLASWQYGLGRVASLSVDLGPRWAREWVDWEGYPRLVAQLARWALRPPAARGAAVEVGRHAQGALLDVQRLGPDGLALAEGGVRAHSRPVGEGDDAWASVALRPIEPGRWRGVVRAAAGQALELRISPDDGPRSIETIVVPEREERQAREGDALALLVATTGGALGPDALGGASPARGRPAELGWLFALLAALLLPFDAWLRRPARRP
jgi:Ca-activated chloride channel homolog